MEVRPRSGLGSKHPPVRHFHLCPEPILSLRLRFTCFEEQLLKNLFLKPSRRDCTMLMHNIVWGCCNEDPCMNNSTCPDGKLEPTYWDRPDQYEYFKDLNILLSSTAPRSISSPTPSASSTTNSSSKPSGAVIGGAIGGSLTFVAIIAAVVFLLCRRKRRNRQQVSRNSAGEMNTSMEGNKPEAGELASPLSVGTGTFGP